MIAHTGDDLPSRDYLELLAQVPATKRKAKPRTTQLKLAGIATVQTDDAEPDKSAAETVTDDASLPKIA